MCVLSRYVATKLWLELARYVATEPWLELGRYVETELWLELGLELGRYVATELSLSVVRLPYSSLPVVGSDTCPLPWTIVQSGHRATAPLQSGHCRLLHDDRGPQYGRVTTRQPQYSRVTASHYLVRVTTQPWAMTLSLRMVSIQRIRGFLEPAGYEVEETLINP
ncbi:hypothetical protein F2Q69_00006008 [Brassica cretica]|uniref:Uncharacterized protein n=1 Tax=Brassica cretica TaxID=69181 RepID=A0A8S9P6Y2_BRACR|nr:hypothetical protein F2Q69_00006008 [Brassica cretica]